MHAMNSITKSDLKEVASFSKPPPLLVPVCDCVLLLLGLKPGFEAFSQLFRKSDGLQSLLAYDRDNIPPKVLRAVAAHIVSMCSPDAMRAVSKAGVCLVQWCQGLKPKPQNCSCRPLSLMLSQECSNTLNLPTTSLNSDLPHSSASTCHSPPYPPPVASLQLLLVSSSSPAIQHLLPLSLSQQRTPSAYASACVCSQAPPSCAFCHYRFPPAAHPHTVAIRPPLPSR